MKAYDILPPSFRGFVALVCFHPYWHRKYRDDFGAAVVLLCAIFQLVIFAVLSVGRERAVWPMLGGFAFFGGSIASIWVCSEIAIIRLHFHGQRRGLAPLLSLQIPAVALILGAFLVAWMRGSIGGIADGILLYPILIGSVLCIAAPLAIWESLRQ